MKKLFKQTVSLFTAAVITAGMFAMPAAADDLSYAAEPDTLLREAAEEAAKKPVGRVDRAKGYNAPSELLNINDIIIPAEEDEPVRDGAVTGKYTYSCSYVYDHLKTDAQKAFYRALKESLDTFAASGKDAKNTYRTGSDKLYYTTPVSFEGLTLDEAINVWWMVYFSEPQYYFFDLNYVFWTKATNGYDAFAPCVLAGMVKASERAKVENAINRTLDEWLPEIEAEVTVTAKEMKIAELICRNIIYDDAALAAMDNNYIGCDGYDQTLVGALYERSCVCAGYAEAFTFLCNAVGIDAFCMTSTVHQWNVVKLYDNWYQLDTTWMDDEGSDPDYSWCNISYDTLCKLDTSGAHEIEELWELIDLPETQYDTVQVQDLGLVDIRVTTPPVKTMYALGEGIDPAGGILTAYYASSAKGEYTEEIPLTAEAVTVSGSIEKVGAAKLTVTYEGMTAEVPIVVYDPQTTSVMVRADGYYSGFDTLSEAFAAIDACSNAEAAYTVTVNRDITEKKIAFPSKAKSVKLTSSGGAVISTGMTAIAPKTDFTLGCTIVNSAKPTKPINITVAKGLDFVLAGGNTVIGTIKGTGTSTLVIGEDVTLSDISNFASVTANAALTLSGKSSGIGLLFGDITLMPTASVSVVSIGRSWVQLQAGTDKKGGLTIPKLTVQTIAAAVDLTVTKDGEPVTLPATGATVMYAADAKKLTGLSTVFVRNTAADEKYLSAVAYGKEIRAEYAEAITVFYPNYDVPDEWFSNNFSTLEKALESLTDPNETYTIVLNEDVTAAKTKLPKQLGGLVFYGNTLTIAGGTYSAKYPLTFADITVKAVDKKGQPAALTIKTSGELTLNGAVFSGKTVNLDGKKIIFG